MTPGTGIKYSNHSAVRLGKSLGQYPTWYFSVWNLPPRGHPLQVRGRTLGGSLRESSYTVEIETLNKPLPKSTLGNSSRRFFLITPKTAVSAYWGCYIKFPTRQSSATTRLVGLLYRSHHLVLKKKTTTEDKNPWLNLSHGLEQRRSLAVGS